MSSLKCLRKLILGSGGMYMHSNIADFIIHHIKTKVVFKQILYNLRCLVFIVEKQLYIIKKRVYDLVVALDSFCSIL